MTVNRAKELSYELFFILMIFAKGIGLDSGNRLYYILSGLACVCVGVKLALTRYRIREIVAMACLCAIAFVAYLNSGRMGIVLSALTVAGLKDMDVKKLFRIGTVVYGASFAFTVIAAKFGVIGNPMVVHEKGGMELVRWGMGYSTGNIFHVSYFMLVALLCYTWGKECNRKRLLGLMAGNLLVYLFTLSYTGVSVTAFYLLLNLYAVKRKGLCLAEQALCQLPLPLCLLFSFGGPFALHHPWMQKLDSMLQARLSYSAYYLQNQPITLLGTRMKDVPNFWIIMDNGYVYFFMTFGVAAFALFCAGYAALIWRYSGIGRRFCLGRDGTDGQRLPELAMIFSFLLYGIMEQFFSNAFMNFSLLFMGEVLFGRQGVKYEGRKSARPDGLMEEEREEERDRKGYWGGLACGMLGVVVCAVYFLAAPQKEFVLASVSALNYVGAQGVQISVAGDGAQTERESGGGKEGEAEVREKTEDKGEKGDEEKAAGKGGKEAGKEEKEAGDRQDGLKEKMKAYGRALETPEVLNAALYGTGMEGRLSAEELAAALEYSIPIHPYGGRDGEVFRVRLLELYYDITQEEYRMLLTYMVELVQEKEEGKYFVCGEVYGEKIGKSAGDDRIEHMGKEKSYQVEKVGNIVKMEHIRDSVFYGTLAAATALAAWTIGRERRLAKRFRHGVRK